MPELPDVEIFRQYLQATALHQQIRQVRVEEPDLLDGVSPGRLRRKLEGEALQSAVRHGKYLFVAAGDRGWLVLHFGMTGFLKYFRDNGSRPDHVRLSLQFAGGYRLAYACPRKLGRIAWCETLERFVADRELGPDPLTGDFDAGDFGVLLEKRRGSIKGLLMNQKALAGIGNIYSDEILFQAAIHPRTAVAELRGEGERLFGRVTDVLRSAIDCRVGERGWPEDWLLPRREPGAECPRCGGRIERIKVVGRSAYLCVDHQQR
jgi:formamidopyrimidine-DNA glycosylase